MVETLETLDAGISDNRELLEMAVEEDDQDTVDAVQAECDALDQHLAQLEFRRMFSGEQDENNAYLEIQSGAGGTEAQDWANMVLRMYLRWAEDKGFKAVITELSEGEVAGIKSATVHVKANMPLVGCGPRRAFTDWCVSRPLTRARGATPALSRCLSHPRLMTTWTSKSTLRI